MAGVIISTIRCHRLNIFSGSGKLSFSRSQLANMLAISKHANSRVILKKGALDTIGKPDIGIIVRMKPF